VSGNVIEVHSLRRQFGKLTAVDDVSFEVGRGEVFGFLGPNGAGKTTTINMLCTLLKPSGGSATVSGFDVERQRSEVRRSIGLVFQQTTLDDYLSAAVGFDYVAVHAPDGTLVAKQAEIYLNTGAHTETGPTVTGRTLTRILGPYRYPNLKINSYCVFTNTVSAASFRSIGGPQTAWATESQLDIIAQKLGIDPVELRLKNLVKKGEEIRPQFRPLDADLFKAFKLVTDKLGWDGPVSKEGRGRGVGFGTTDPGAPLASTSTVHVLADGSVVLLCGTSELGQGAKTVMSQITAEELRVPLERVTIQPIDTGYTPFDRSTGSSRSTTVMGKAVQLAGADGRQQILELATEHFECPEDAVTLQDGMAMAGGKKISYGELIHKHFAMQGGELVGRGYAHSGMAPTPANPLFWEIGIGAVELEVDRETGQVHVEKYITAADAGKALHPLQCEGQDEGSAMMGFGHTFYESYQFDGGQIVNSTLVDYKVPTFDDVPREFESILIEDANGPGPYGAKGLGEGGIIPVAPAVANAVAWCTGARVKSLPLTPEKVWRAICEKDLSR